MANIVSKGAAYTRKVSYGLVCKLCSRVNLADELLRDVDIDDAQDFTVHERCYQRWT